MSAATSCINNLSEFNSAILFLVPLNQSCYLRYSLKFMFISFELTVVVLVFKTSTHAIFMFSYYFRPDVFPDIYSCY